MTETNEGRLTEESATEAVPTETEEAATEIEVTETEEEETTGDAYKTADAKADENGFIIEYGVLTGYTGPGGDIVIPEGVTQIGKNEWNGYTSYLPKYLNIFGDNITSITIPKSVSEIACDSNYLLVRYGELEESAFNPFQCKNLKRIIVEEGNVNFKAIDGILYKKNKDIEIYGILDGFAGLINGKYKKMEKADFDNILLSGGTILGTSRQPFKTQP